MISTRGRLERCWLFAYQTPVEAARALLPPPLEPVTHRGRAFWNVVVSRIGAMRPRGLPKMLGVSYWHVAYRLYARAGDLEGLYFVRSDCDNAWMSVAGNWMTDYRFHTAGVDVDEHPDRVHISVRSPEAPAEVSIDRTLAPERPPYSVFASLDAAAAALKYKPMGLSVDGGRVRAVRITRDESAWRARPVAVTQDHWSFLSGRPVRPELCVEVAPIDYQWA